MHIGTRPMHLAVPCAGSAGLMLPGPMLDIAWSHAHMQAYVLNFDCVLHACAENTNLTSIEQPQTASTNLVEFTYTSNVQTSGDIPKFLGSLTNLTTLNLYNSGFNGSIPGELCHLLIPDGLRRVLALCLFG